MIQIIQISVISITSPPKFFDEKLWRVNTHSYIGIALT